MTAEENLKLLAESLKLVAVNPGRLYRVRPAKPTDHPALLDGSVGTDFSLTIERLDGAKRIVHRSTDWADTDAWGSKRWRDCEKLRKKLRARG